MPGSVIHLRSSFSVPNRDQRLPLEGSRAGSARAPAGWLLNAPDRRGSPNAAHRREGTRAGLELRLRRGRATSELFPEATVLHDLALGPHIGRR